MTDANKLYQVYRSRVSPAENSEIMAAFEKAYSHCALAREESQYNHELGYFYLSGVTNQLFWAYQAGYLAGLDRGNTMQEA